MANIYPQAPVSAPDGAPTPKRGMSPWLIVLIVLAALIVLCCICGLAAVLLAGPTMGNVFSQVMETLEVMTPVP